jgi:hypothetical protein
MADLDDLKAGVDYFWKTFEVLISSINELYKRVNKQNENLNDIAKEIIGIRSIIDSLEKKQHRE